MDSFAPYRQGLAELLTYLLVIISMVMLVVVIVCILNGDREGLKKFGSWFILVIIGLIFLNVLVGLSW